MKIEFIVDENCLSVNTFMDIVNKLALEFSENQITITSFENNRQRLKNLGISILPVWLINDEALRIRPDDYHALRKKIKARIEQHESIFNFGSYSDTE